MKKFLSVVVFILLTLIAISTKVQATDVSTDAELKDTLAAGENEIILTSDISTSGTIEITKGVTINGDGNKITFANNVDGFQIKTAEKVELSNIKIEAWRGIGISNTVFDLTVKDSTITGRQRGISLNLDGNTNSKLTIINSTIQQAGYEGKYDVSCSSDGSTGNYRGISLWELTNSTVNITNSTIQGFGYNINLTGSNRSFAGTTLNIENSNFKGRTAINSFATDYTINMKNSNIHGINNYSGKQESFADIVLTGNNTKLNISNTKFTNYQDETGMNNPNALQFMLALRGSNNIVKVSGNTTFVDSTNKLGTNFECVGSNTLEISGGKYSYDVKEYVGDGLTTYESGSMFIVDKIGTLEVAQERIYVKIGDTFKLGVSASVEDLEDYIEISKDKDDIITIDGDTITGLKLGKTIITAKLGESEKKIEVIVYEVKAVNKLNEETQTSDSVVNETVEKAILNGDELNGITDDQKAELVQAMEDGKTIETELKTGDMDKEAVDVGDVEKIEEILDENEKVAGYYDISVLLKVDDVEVGKLTELDSKIRITVDVPDNIENVQEGYNRTYSVIRIHNEKAEALDTEYEEGKVTFETDKFSTYAVTYKDTQKVEETKEEVKNEEQQENNKTDNLENKAEIKSETKTETKDVKVVSNPKTGDEVVVAAVALVLAVIGIVVVNKVRK